MGGDWGELPPVCDFEMTTYAPEPAVANGKLWNFLQALERITGKIPMIYSGYFYWHYYGTSNIGWAKYPWWLPWYESEASIATSMAYYNYPMPWKKWTFWQYTGNGNGPQYGSTGLSMDMNYFNGTIEELKIFAGTTPPPVQTLEQRVSKLEQEAKTHGWNI
jgi:lysozyme